MRNDAVYVRIGAILRILALIDIVRPVLIVALA